MRSTILYCPLEVVFAVLVLCLPTRPWMAMVPEGLVEPEGGTMDHQF